MVDLAGVRVSPWCDRRSWSAFLLASGSSILVAGAFLTAPWINAGLMVAGLGALLGAAPVLRLPGSLVGIAFTAWVGISVLVAWTTGIPGGRLRLPGAAYLWLATPLVALGLAEARLRHRAMNATIAVAALAVILAAVQFFVGLGGDFPRVDPAGERLTVARGFSDLHLTFGLACALLLTWSLQGGRDAGAGRISWSARGFALAGLAVCGSRSAVLGAAAGIWASFSARGRRWALVGIIAALVLGGALGAWQWMANPLRTADVLAMRNGRWPVWSTSLHLIHARPLTGLGGKDAFQAAYRTAFPLVNPGAVSEFPAGAAHAHNTALALTAEYGLPALLLHMLYWGTVLWWLWRRRHECPEAWRLGLGVAVVAFVGGQFEPYPTRVVQGAAIHAFLGLAVALALSPRSSPHGPPPMLAAGAPCASPPAT